jgi:uncharacterized membrane protein YcaP (DUF421 family)
MGKREIGELGLFDLVVFLMIAELVAISIEELEEPIMYIILPIIILIFLQIILAKLSLRFKKIRFFFDGRASLFISKGKINLKELKRQKYNLDDLMMQARQKEVRTLSEIDYAVLETDGTLSVFKKSDQNKKVYPLAIIQDGEIMLDNLKGAKISKLWVLKELEKRNICLKDVFYGYLEKNNLKIIKRKDLL